MSRIFMFVSAQMTTTCGMCGKWGRDIPFFSTSCINFERLFSFRDFSRPYNIGKILANFWASSFMAATRL
ncbi:uncharacterized protein PHALS_14609 [Plasmopara halstedii]|uniref:Uncharacterized protein n=1 Tax=Plasmopara halstedii TaxID=4781 RepID=A0A0N7L5S3_PLAHL|nr:uncharacterized protein PHALS_14609 [Plasmopara halstedii]CEG42275.1 hypothetical protein PHALS_14609 [Plasmopara halstedii]|eukprot:XP_024578644.1 hypothetical protein PHALS_14609 [Plasmopara halstedii]